MVYLNWKGEQNEFESLAGLYCIHLELSSRCQKCCWMCGRRKLERDYPNLVNWGDMDFELVRKISHQIPAGIVMQFHNSGEPFLYPRLGEALDLFPKQIKCLDTNGKLLVEKADQVIDKLDTITISVIENDSEADEQYETVKKFLEIKGDKKPLMVYRLLGDVGYLKDSNFDLTTIEGKNKYDNRINRWKELPGMIVTRLLHDPMMSKKYKKPATRPEIGMCVEILNHMAINRFGDVSCCVRFDVNKEGVLGNVNNTPLVDIWNSPERKRRIELHKQGKRSEIPLCNKCEFWGVPTSS